MSIAGWFRTPRIRKSLALGAVVLAAGGLILARAPVSPGAVLVASPSHGSNSTGFSGSGAHGTFALSHGKVLSSGETRLFAEIDLAADRDEQAPRERAPISLAVVLDTSGSMGGEKIERAREAVIGLLGQMRDDDEVAFIRYASDTELVQPLTRLGAVRSALVQRVGALQAGGGTNIPPALSMGLAQLAGVAKGRVRRVVLASDGLDSTRARAESVAHDGAGQGVTISSMGIGLDFDEGYMGGVARAGRGNFAFVKDGAALSGFLQKELVETATTTLEGATARLRLPRGVRFVQAIGADAKRLGDGSEIELGVGSLFAGDERRIVVELAATASAGEVLRVDGRIGWSQIGGDTAEARLGALEVSGTSDPGAVDDSRDGSVFANAVSALASTRQLAATEAYNRGDAPAAQALIQQNLADLRVASAWASPKAAAPVARQMAAYAATAQAFASAPPASDRGKMAAKSAAQSDLSNMARSAF